MKERMIELYIKFFHMVHVCAFAFIYPDIYFASFKENFLFREIPIWLFYLLQEKYLIPINRLLELICFSSLQPLLPLLYNFWILRQSFPWLLLNFFMNYFYVILITMYRNDDSYYYNNNVVFYNAVFKKCMYELTKAR